ncbi:hypothetical protein NCCP2222_19560 [Sporosarcina sp. NCCP-2222]|uniref:hypothetical protein n=1 Tax=Sporosarcina sp. NCCP-2222 TaxID=2935073 RepID=UPI00207E69F3|nr:hypothetical protein [Sporosarcina sp. NCCP-2222]GKV56009.1 hypothetical protein NCCP2222_19560 [Sporosarcina sp. NCCP-2222]
MKLEDYKSEDIEEVLELKTMALQQISEIERAIWTDNVNEATARAAHLFGAMQKVRVLKNKKSDEEKMKFLVSKLMDQGVNAQVVVFGHKKTD